MEVSTQRVSCQEAPIIVDIASTETDIEEGMRFCGRHYLRSYKTQWRVAPDVLFIARSGDSVVGTAGLELGGRHAQFGAEKYFHLSPKMRSFIEARRAQSAEFGRFSSVRKDIAQALFHAAINFLEGRNVIYLFAWANPAIYCHLTEKLGIPFWRVDVPVNRDAVETDTDWEVPPTGFFFRPQPPTLLISVLPFWDIVNRELKNLSRGIVVGGG